MVGAVGDDAFGQSALAGLNTTGVDISTCRVNPDTRTGIALIVVDENGENQIVTAPGANAALDGNLVREALRDVAVPIGSVCLLGFEVGDDALIAVADWASARGIRMS